MALCWACGDGRVIVDPASGAQVCDSCGTEHASDEFRHESFTADGRPVGHLINSVGEFGDKERKIRDAKAVVSELTARLGLSGSRASEAESMVSDVTDGAFGNGVWFPVLVGACSYLVMRRHSLPLPLAEVADAIGCDVPEVGRMVSRVVRQLDLEPLPEFDAVQSLERAVRYCPSLSGLGTEKTEELIGQGRFLLHCAIKWFLMTGRQPLPMIAAVVAFVAKVNGVVVEVEEIAREIYANVSTSQLRLKELSNTLIRVARALLPWGEDVTVKNLAQNAPVLIRIMEMKSKSRINSEGSEDMGFNLNDFVEANSNPGEEEEDSKYYKVGDKDGALNMSEDELERLKLSGKLLSQAYKNVLDKLGQIKERGELGKDLGKKRKRRRGFDFDAVKDSWQWEGRWEADKGLKLKQVLQKDVGYEALPPSFVAGVEARRKRRMRIEDARHRISEVMKPLSKSDSNAKEKPSILKSLVGRERRRGVGEDMVDWEDCIIELLLLHGVHENEIEQGQYRRLNIKLEGICKAWRMLLTHFCNQISQIVAETLYSAWSSSSSRCGGLARKHVKKDQTIHFSVEGKRCCGFKSCCKID